LFNAYSYENKNYYLIVIQVEDALGNANEKFLEIFINPQNEGQSKFGLIGDLENERKLGLIHLEKDPDGVGNDIRYTWQSSENQIQWSDIGYSETYLIKPEENGLYVRAKISYTDENGFLEEIISENIDWGAPLEFENSNFNLSSISNNNSVIFASENNNGSDLEVFYKSQDGWLQDQMKIGFPQTKITQTSVSDNDRILALALQESTSSQEQKIKT